MGAMAAIHDRKGLRLALFSIHGLIRGDGLELGRDADTGGQALYVVELAQALGRRDDVAQVDLFTRRVVDPSVAPGYAQPVERLSGKVRIVRIECGPAGYLRKEDLWDHLDAFADNASTFWRDEGQDPEVIHSHYADAGYVGIRLANQLGLPLAHTGHSLGRVKRRRLLASGISRDDIEERYNISRRIMAEEDTLACADRVIVSTANEIEQQYSQYKFYHPERMRIIPPGTDLDRFYPPDGTETGRSIYPELCRFLEEPEKPMILALSRPDERKNISTLIEAFGNSPELQRLANLVIVAGQREDVREMDPGPARVLLDVLLNIDAYDLHGKVAYPKRHSPEDVPVLYRLAASSGGVFINPALTEPFGLTLIEAAASGVPIVATEDGGPRDIIANCENGYLIDPLDAQAMAETLLRLLQDHSTWQTMARNGLKGVARHYSWDAHAQRYVDELKPLLARREKRPQPVLRERPILYHDRALFTDIDQNLLGDPDSLARFTEVVRERQRDATFGIATGRTLESALRTLRKHSIPRPDVLISSVGTHIHYGPNMTEDTAWSRHIDHLWKPRALRSVLAEVSGLKLQPKSELSDFKLSFYYDATEAPPLEEIQSLLHENDQTVQAFVSFGQYLDIIPIRASKGFALRWFAEHWGIPLERILVAGGSGTDEDMMRGNTLAVVVAHRHQEELSRLVDLHSIYFAQKTHAAGILEAIEHYDFFGECLAPQTS
jgi:sucrose-phosphate synthase